MRWCTAVLAGRWPAVAGLHHDEQTTNPPVHLGSFTPQNFLLGFTKVKCIRTDQKVSRWT